MCHDISFSASTVEFITDLLPGIVFDCQVDIDFSTTSHVLSMTNRECFVVYNKEGVPHGNLFEWGLIADYMNTPEKVKQYRIQMANARSEKVFDKAAAWYRLRKNRCLIFVNGFYEHREVKGWKNKVPYYIRLANRPAMCLLGFYNYSPLADRETGEMKGTFTIVTRAANAVMQQIHNHGTNKHRMPVMMQPEAAVKWIDEQLTDEEMKAMLDYEIPAADLEYWPVFTLRSPKQRPDDRDKFEPFDWPKLPPLGSDEIGEQQALFGTS